MVITYWKLKLLNDKVGFEIVRPEVDVAPEAFWLINNSPIVVAMIIPLLVMYRAENSVYIGAVSCHSNKCAISYNVLKEALGDGLVA